MKKNQTEIKQLYQPMGSKLCGQTCIAMIAGISLDEAITAVGHRRRTTSRDWERAFIRLGIRCASRKQRLSSKRQMPDLVIAKLKHPSRRVSHAIVIHKGTIFDPLPRTYTTGWRITSYFTVHKEIP